MYISLLALKSLYFILPCLFANMAPVLARNYNILNTPVDLGRRWRGKRLFGNNKTYRGFLFGIIYATIIVYIQTVLYLDFPAFRDISLIDYSSINVFLLGSLLGIGTLFGDLIESFFKRQKGIPSGGSWIPWDQLDLLIGALIFLAPVYIPPLDSIAFLFVAVPIIHISAKHLGYYLSINKSRW